MHYDAMQYEAGDADVAGRWCWRACESLGLPASTGESLLSRGECSAGGRAVQGALGQQDEGLCRRRRSQITAVVFRILSQQERGGGLGHVTLCRGVVPAGGAAKRLYCSAYCPYHTADCPLFQSQGF